MSLVENLFEQTKTALRDSKPSEAAELAALEADVKQKGEHARELQAEMALREADDASHAAALPSLLQSTQPTEHLRIPRIRHTGTLQPQQVKRFWNASEPSPHHL